MGMLERLNGDEKGDAIVSVRGYEPIWARFTASYELKDIYFAAGKADISKGQSRLFKKTDYVYDIVGGSQVKEEDKVLDGIERREKEQAEEEHKQANNLVELDKQWKDMVEEVHAKVLKVAEALLEEDGKALLKAKLEDKQTLIRLFMDGYDQSIRQKLQTLSKWLENYLPKIKELQEQVKK
jgi:hypothetical protein